jgi:hypothetical protein
VSAVLCERVAPRLVGELLGSTSATPGRLFHPSTHAVPWRWTCDTRVTRVVCGGAPCLTQRAQMPSDSPSRCSPLLPRDTIHGVRPIQSARACLPDIRKLVEVPSQTHMWPRHVGSMLAEAKAPHPLVALKPIHPTPRAQLTLWGWGPQPTDRAAAHAAVGARADGVRADDVHQWWPAQASTLSTAAGTGRAAPGAHRLHHLLGNSPSSLSPPLPLSRLTPASPVQ